MNHLYYVRHGESLANTTDKFGTKPGAAGDLGLTEKGRQQAYDGARVAARQGFKPDAIVCSPLKRARETAAIYAEVLEFPADQINIQDDLVELQFGELEGQPWNAWFEQGNSYADLGDVPGAESIEDLQKRAAAAFETLKQMPEDTVLVIGHSAFGRALRRVVDGKPASDEFIDGTSLPHGDMLRLL